MRLEKFMIIFMGRISFWKFGRLLIPPLMSYLENEVIKDTPGGRIKSHESRLCCKVLPH